MVNDVVQHVSMASLRHVLQFHHDASFERIVACSVIATASADDIRSAERDVEASLSPCGPQHALNEMSRLRMSTVFATQQGQQIDLVAQNKIYVESLACYPADILTKVCRERWRFWPPLVDIINVCDNLLRERRIMLAALKREPRKRPTSGNDDGGAPTAEDRAYVAQRVREAKEALQRGAVAGTRLGSVRN